MDSAGDHLSARAAGSKAEASLRTWGRLGIAAALACALTLPFAVSGYRIYQFSQVLTYAIALLGLNLLTGYNGQISLGHGAFFAIGGYTTAILVVKLGVPSWATIPVAGIVCFVAGFLFGFPALRLGGIYLALATFALALATPQLLKFKAVDEWTGGVQGLLLSKPKVPFGLPLTPDQWLYFVCLACTALLFWAAANLVSGRIGRAMVAIREHPVAAEAMGIDIAFYKTMTFGVSALYTGIAGALSGMVAGVVAPDSFGFFLSLSFLVGIVVGGLASIWGVIVGALFIEFVPIYADRIASLLGEGAKALPWAIYGVLLIGLMYMMPAGAAGAVKAVVRRLGRLTAGSRSG
ncbi:MAG: branched-chain amino acid ABC transporter permease [Methylobacteriaceae bacterium]|nr:branched-chain amino acid ABC transporter permease [Methylobacteriaceae bacterium]